MREPQEYLSDDTPLITAAHLGKLRLVRLLVEGGAQVNERNQRGETPLLAACKALRGDGGAESRLRLLRYLLENEADPNAQDKAGRTALMYACMKKAGPAVAKALIGAGADPGMEDYAGASALVYAVNARQQGTLRTLLDACRERGRDIIIIATDLSTDGGSVTRRYLNVPPSPDSSPVACMSPSEIELRTGGGGAEGENIFDFGGVGRKGGGGGALPDLDREGRGPHSHRLRSEPWLAIHNLAHLRSSYEEGQRQAAVREDEEDGEEGPPDLNVCRRSSVHPPSKALSPDGPLPHLARRNTLPCLQDTPLLQLPSLNLVHCGSDSHLQAPPVQVPGRRSQLSVNHASTWSLAPAQATDKKKGSQLRTSFLPPLPISPATPSQCPAAPAVSEMPPRPPWSMPRLGGRWGRRLQRRHSIQLDQTEPVGQKGSSEEILIL